MFCRILLLLPKSWQPSRSSELLEATSGEETTTACSSVIKPNFEVGASADWFSLLSGFFSFHPLRLNAIPGYNCGWFIFVTVCLPNQKSPHTYSDLAHSHEIEFLAAASLFSGSHTDFDSDEAITFSWRKSCVLWLHFALMLAIIQECSHRRYFSQETTINVRLSPATFLPAQSSFGVRRSRRTWGPGLL